MQDVTNNTSDLKRTLPTSNFNRKIENNWCLSIYTILSTCENMSHQLSAINKTYSKHISRLQLQIKYANMKFQQIKGLKSNEENS